MEPRLPSKIVKGDLISIIAPGSPVRDKKAFREGVRLLTGLGFRVRESEHLYDRYFLYAGDDEVRAGEVNRSFADPAVSAIFCARGGAGSLRILPLLDYGTISRNPKIFLGYSDTTAVQLALLKRAGLISFYGPMVETDLGRQLSAERKEQLFSLLLGESALEELYGTTPGDVITLHPGEASGRLVGGCLSIFVSLLGTAFEPDTTDAILFFEDIHEYPHRIDRYLTQLMLAGKLQVARGLVFGSFRQSAYPPDRDCDDLQTSALDIVREKMSSLKIPSIYGLPFGHVRSPYTIPLGGYAHLDATRQLLVPRTTVT